MASHVKPGSTGAIQEQTPRFARLHRKIAAIWERSHISRRSEYSVERLLAFRDYHQRASNARVIAVCVLTPIPALLVALAIDCIPLKPPSDGWQANYAVWIRLTVAMFVEVLGVIWHVREVITTGTISNAGALTIALCTAVTSVLATIAVAGAWRFPLPFGYVLMTNLYVLIFSACTILVIDPRVLGASSSLRQQIKSQLFIIANQGVVAVCYPIFSAVFNRLSAAEQAVFVFVMPLIKFVTKQNIANAAKNSHEYIAPMVVFSVDLFNVYYVAICMQSAKSMTTTLILIATDSFFVIISIRAIYNRANCLQASNKSQDGYLQDLLAVVRKLDNVLVSKAREDIVRDALQTLFHSEYILLAEYIEVMVPMLYSFYLVVLFHLPVAAYYPHTASMTAHELQGAVTTILAYAAVELVSFTTLLILLWRKFGFSPLYQLAFVLETQGTSLQGYLFVWTITTLHLTLAHYGVDFNISLT
ncbi:hypothetical protein PHYPSEUDO_013263 [Phytophthora pseudosyringae]|uniref:Transmembrane protein n=1 Tax=Phytophthora pseudosyringae TaxID=221518 RepID=A0A8T1W3X0_9STRA|nr:hypothetical protein PHYPSEUDO_013263 [Phytophthora pseudosyringae]